jgi:hypothetical protein
MESETVALIGIGFATTGWIYNSRRARQIARKQHTINIILQATFNSDFRKSVRLISHHLKDRYCPPNVLESDDIEIRDAYRFILNHYEFLAAGIRNGDLDEQLIIDNERGTILVIYKTCEAMIFSVRNSRERVSLYEHMEWLQKRWLKARSPIAKAVELVIARPLAGARHNPHS